MNYLPLARNTKQKKLESNRYREKLRL